MPCEPAGGVDALDPQAAELALAGPAVTEGVLPRVHDLLVGGAVRAALVAVVALGPLEDLPAVLLRRDGSLDPGHQRLLSDGCGRTVGSALAEQALDPLLVAGVRRRPCRRGGGCASRTSSRTGAGASTASRRSLPVPVLRNRLAAVLLVFIFGMGWLSVWCRSPVSAGTSAAGSDGRRRRAVAGDRTGRATGSGSAAGAWPSAPRHGSAACVGVRGRRS